MNEPEMFDARRYMEMAVEVMKKSIQEPRDDKTSPKVGAVLLKPDGQIETAFRGELRHGDHAEFTLLERKNRAAALDGSVLFATLEPCAPGARKHPKLGCAQRIVNARIKKVWVGVEDPDPTVDRKGIKFLLDNGIDVEMFDPDLQAEIWNENKLFKEQAEERAKKAKVETEELNLTEKEKAEPNAVLEDFSSEAVNWFLTEAKIQEHIGSNGFLKIFSQLGLLKEDNGQIRPTGLGILLFGKKPEILFPHAVVRATFRTAGRGESLETIGGPLIYQAEKLRAWYESHIRSQVDRSNPQREILYDYPLVVLREAIVNAVVHRDYDIEGAPIFFEINDEAIIIKSPGAPVEPIKVEQIKNFNAPSLSRNPKLMFVFDQLKLVEHRGLGFLTMKELPSKFQLPLPIVTYEAPYMVFKFPKDRAALKSLLTIPEIHQLSPIEAEGYHWIALHDEVSARQYAAHFNIGYKTANRQLNKMKQLGLLTDNGKALTSPNYRYMVSKPHNL